MILLNPYQYTDSGYGLKPYLYSFYEFSETTGNFIDRHSRSEATLSAGAERDSSGLTGAGFKTNELTTTPYIEMDGGPYTGLSGTSKASYPTLTNESTLVFWIKHLELKASQRTGNRVIIVANGDESSTGGFKLGIDYHINSYPTFNIQIGGTSGTWMATSFSDPFFGDTLNWNMIVVAVSESTSSGRILYSYNGSAISIVSPPASGTANSSVEPTTLRFGCGVTTDYGIKAVYDKFMYFQNYILTNDDITFLYNSGAGRIYNEI